MKYKDLIEKLLPFADDEIDLAVYSGDVDDNNVIDEVRFFSKEKFICGAKEQYNSYTIETVGESIVF